MPRSKFTAFVLAVLLLLAGIGWAAPDHQQQVDNLTGFATDIRADLERAAIEVFPDGLPDEWTGNIDNTSPTYIPDLWFDKELLANGVFGGDRRPPNWISVTVDVADILARNVRHDLEEVADVLFGGFGERPIGWNGAAGIYRCDRAVMNIYFLAVAEFSFVENAQQDEFGFCAEVEAELNFFLLEQQQLDLSGAELDAAILSTRGDIERLADEVFGVNDRPIGWSGNRDENSPLLLADNRADVDLLADETLGVNRRPEGWASLFLDDSQVLSWRNVRHDLELLTEELVPQFPSIEGDRPRGWENEDPMRICSLRLQTLVVLLEAVYNEEGAIFSRFDVPATDNYCTRLFTEANNFAEDPPLSEIDALLAGGPVLFESDFAFAYLDVSALEYMGIMPGGTQFRAWYRNFNDSTMMFVSGENFAVYIDQRFTTMPVDIFDRLPTLEGVQPLTFCDASWCNGPGPTPTPTGGAIESLLAFETPVIQPTVDTSEQLPEEQKTQVNFENIRVNYLLDDEQARTAEVILEICPDPSLVAVPGEPCEPVLSVVDGATAEPFPVIRQQDGQNVYSLPYGYSQNVIISSATLVSNDVFLSPPELPRN